MTTRKEIRKWVGRIERHIKWRTEEIETARQHPEWFPGAVESDGTHEGYDFDWANRVLESGMADLRELSARLASR